MEMLKDKKLRDGLSIVIPFYKGKSFIRRCVQSIIDSYSNFDNIKIEILIIIDSGEHVDEVSQLLPQNNIIKVFKNKNNIGVAKTRNEGLIYSEFSWITFIDQDDCVDIKYFEKITKYLQKNSSNDFILINGFYVFNANKIPIYYFKPQLNLRKFIFRNRVHTPGLVIFNRSRINDLIDFRNGTAYAGTDDLALFLNLFLHPISYFYINEKLFYYMIHEDNFSKNIIEARFSTFYTLQDFKSRLKESNKLLDLKIKAVKFEILWLKKKAHIYGVPYYCLLSVLFQLDPNKLAGFIHKKFNLIWKK